LLRVSNAPYGANNQEAAVEEEEAEAAVEEEAEAAVEEEEVHRPHRILMHPNNPLNQPKM